MPAGLKRALEVLLARGGPALAARATLRNGVLVLAYHNVIPNAASAGEHSLHLSIDWFRRQLDLLQRWLRVVPLVELTAEATDHQPRAAITLDDAYRGAVSLALEELRQRGLPATMFVPPGRLGGEWFWWDALAVGGAVAPEVRRHALDQLRGEEDAIRAWAREAGLTLREPPELLRSATADELDSAAYAGLTFGSHSWSHANLARLSEADLARELAASHDWLASRYGSAYVPWLAFPYGLFAPKTCDAARARGFVGALRIEGGWTQSPLADPLAVPRLNVPAGLSPDGFALRISGLRRP